MTTATAATVKQRPIIFSDQMVRAILDGRKTQTRRVMNPQPPAWVETFGSSVFTPHGHISGRGYWKGVPGDEGPAEKHFRSPYGCAWERLWVRETYMVQPTPGCTFGEAMKGTKLSAFYRDGSRLDLDNGWEASGPGLHVWGTNHEYPAERYGIWRPSIHMPRWASRILLDVVSVRVQRLHDITPEDCRAEGIEVPRCGCEACAMTSAICPADASAYMVDYRLLWDKINANRGHPWRSNPWVWVIEFRRVTPE